MNRRGRKAPETTKNSSTLLSFPFACDPLWVESDEEEPELEAVWVISLRTWTVATYKNVPAERSRLNPVIGNWTVYMTWNEEG